MGNNAQERLDQLIDQLRTTSIEAAREEFLDDLSDAIIDEPAKAWQRLSSRIGATRAAESIIELLGQAVAAKAIQAQGWKPQGIQEDVPAAVFPANVVEYGLFEIQAHDCSVFLEVTGD